MYYLFENEDNTTSHSSYYLPKVEIKDYNVDGKNIFDQPINSMAKTYKNIRKITIGQGDDYTTGCLLPRAIQQISFTADLDRGENTTFFIIEEAKETFFKFSQGTVKVLWGQFS